MGTPASQPSAGRTATDFSQGPRKTRLLELRQEIPARVYWGAGVSFFVLVLLVWGVLTGFGLVPPIFLPGPGAVWQELLRQVREAFSGRTPRPACTASAWGGSSQPCSPCLIAF
jgi:NitT/TauT family transport system permease protein